VPTPKRTAAELIASCLEADSASAWREFVWLKTKLNVDTSSKKLRTTFLDYVFQTKRANSNLKTPQPISVCLEHAPEAATPAQTKYLWVIEATPDAYLATLAAFVLVTSIGE
jgi:hypothetical protein